MGSLWRNAYSLRMREGPEYDHWRRKTILALMNLDATSTNSLGILSDDQLREVLTAGVPAVLP